MTGDKGSAAARAAAEQVHARHNQIDQDGMFTIEPIAQPVTETKAKAGRGTALTVNCQRCGLPVRPRPGSDQPGLHFTVGGATCRQQ